MKHNATSSTLLREEPRLLETVPELVGPSRPLGLPPRAKASKIPPTRRIVTEGRVLFLFAFGVYLTVAVLLDFKYQVYPADAFSRMANGFYVIYSADPHLGAVGFVWEPLQSMADLVVLLGNHLWPALSQDDMAGSLVSAVSMAAAVYQICAALREWGVSRTPRLVLTALFAADPMILYYGGNGMSEALYLFTLTASTRYLLRWMRDGDLRSLAYSAVALGFCYLTRNEAALAALFGGITVGAVSYWRAVGTRRSRLRTGASDLVIFAAPAFTAALGWAICSYVIIGALIDGGALSTRLAHQQQNVVPLQDRIVYAFHALEALAPFLLVLLLIGVIIAVRRKDPRILAPVSVLGGALSFDALSYLGNAITNALRYWIAVIPLVVLVLGAVIAAVQNPRQTRVGVTDQDRPPRAGVSIVGVLVALCLALIVMIPTIVFTASGMLNDKVGVEESQQIGWIFNTHDTRISVYPLAHSVDTYLGGRHFPNHDVLVDNADASGCVAQIIVRSSQPKLFVIPNDRDFQRVLADPIAFQTHYLLVPDPSTSEEPGAVNKTYPTIWGTGAEFAKDVHQFRAQSACPAYRLFKVLRHPTLIQ